MIEWPPRVSLLTQAGHQPGRFLPLVLPGQQVGQGPEQVVVARERLEPLAQSTSRLSSRRFARTSRYARARTCGRPWVALAAALQVPAGLVEGVAVPGQLSGRQEHVGLVGGQLAGTGQTSFAASAGERSSCLRYQARAR